MRIHIENKRGFKGRTWIGPDNKHESIVWVLSGKLNIPNLFC